MSGINRDGVMKLAEVVLDAAEAFKNVFDEPTEEEKSEPVVAHDNSGIVFRDFDIGSVLSVVTKSGYLYLFVKTGQNNWKEYELVNDAGHRIKPTAGTTGDWGMEQMKRNHTISVVKG